MHCIERDRLPFRVMVIQTPEWSAQGVVMIPCMTMGYGSVLVRPPCH